jgi:serine/threonine-protein kinase
VQASAFQIVAPLGAGGMGEVFRARDTRLNREVALKMLPASLAADADRLARFTREAQLLAALNHANIAAIYGLEEMPGDGAPAARALVLELVEGPTLAERITHDHIPLDEALAIARQVADAVEYAHDHGIIHRDLKPANIKLRPDGVVKVLDFGLAKALAGPGTPVAPEVTESPTLSNRATAAGVVLGTAAYMSPEQARGQAVDRRADVWAFGVVLFEMLARRRPFAGATISDTIAAILKDEPDWARLPASTPRGLRRLLGRLLEKDPRNRLRDIGDARLLLDDAAAHADEAAPPGTTPTASPRWLRALPWGLLVLMAALTPAAMALWPRAAPASRPLRFTIEPPELTVDNARIPVVSPDGTRLIFSDGNQLLVRALDELEAQPVPGTADAQYPFWSPDSRQIAYLTPAGLWRHSLDDAAPARIASANFPRGGSTPGGVWRRDGSIVFASASEGTSLDVVPSTGGELAPLFERDPAAENDFHRPSLLPDGHRMLAVVDRPHDGADTIAVVDGNTRKIVLQLPDSVLDCPVYLPTGHLVFTRQTRSRGVWAVPFSLERLETTGVPWLVAPDSNYPSVGGHGLIVYAREPKPGLEELVWLDIQTGRATPANLGTFSEVTGLRLSPDGTRLAVVARLDDTHQVQVVDLERGTRVNLGQGDPFPSQLAWVDDRTVMFSTDRQRGGQLTLRRADGSQPAVTLFAGFHPAIAAGHLVFVRRESGVLASGLWHTALGPEGRATAEPTVLLQTPVHEWGPALSADGTLLAYTSGEPTGAQVILRRYPGADGRWQVSTAGGRDPVWSSTGRTIYFRNVSGEIFAVDVTRSPEIALGAPRRIKGPATLVAQAGFDVSRDGKRLLVPQRTAAETSRAALIVVHGWTPDAAAQSTNR